MIASLRSWFGALSLREKRLVLVAAVLAVVTLLWFGLIRPLGDALSDAKSRHSNAVVRLAETEAQLATVKALQRNRPAPMAAPLEDTVRARAADAGFTLASVTPQSGNGLQIAISSARPAALFGWVADLEASGILVDSLTTTDNGDQTVSVTMVLKAQGI